MTLSVELMLDPSRLGEAVRLQATNPAAGEEQCEHLMRCPLQSIPKGRVEGGQGYACLVHIPELSIREVAPRPVGWREARGARLPDSFLHGMEGHRTGKEFPSSQAPGSC